MERAANTITDVGAGKKIEKVETTEDTIMYAGTTHEEFVRLYMFGLGGLNNLIPVRQMKSEVEYFGKPCDMVC